MKLIRLLAAPLATLVCSAAPHTNGAPPPIVVLVLDDVGTDMLGVYGDPSANACTPFLDSFAASGVRFSRFYTDPSCSPTRAQLLSGRHGNRTGVGAPIAWTTQSATEGLQSTEVLLPEALMPAGYVSAALGKWHLAGAGSMTTHPNDLGFLHFAGTVHGGLGSSPDAYWNWQRTENGVTAPSNVYATTQTALDAIAVGAQMLAAGVPPFLWVAFNSAHSPYHRAPMGLCPQLSSCSCADPNPPAAGTFGARRYDFETMVESLDSVLADLVQLIDAATGGRAWIFIMGDNGTPGTVKASGLTRGAKGAMYEGGVRVPFLARGPGVVPRVVDDLVQSTDLFATICELAGVPTPPEAADSISFAPLLFGSPSGARTTCYLEAFKPNGLPLAPAQWRQIAVEERWKLYRRNGAPDELFDLTADPREQTNLAPPATPEAAAALARLSVVLNGLGR